VRDRALADGAVRAHVLDVREEFARAFLLPALKAGALYDDGRSLTTGLLHQLIARTLVEIAAIEQTSIVAHGAATDARIGDAIRALNPAITIAVPPLAAGGVAAVRGAAPKTPAECPDEAAFIEITFKGGTPAALNGITMSLLDLIGSVDVLAGAHGIERTGGLDTPGAFVLHIAHADLQRATSSAAAARFSQIVSREYIGVIDGGLWFTPHREALDAYIDRASAPVTGVVRLQLSKGACAIVETRANDLRLETDEHSVVRPLRFRA
jgi:argininosuccinate synthase